MANEATIETLRTSIAHAIRATEHGQRRELVAAVVTVPHDELAREKGIRTSQYVSWTTPGQSLYGKFIAATWLVDYRGVRHDDGTTSLFSVSAKQLRGAVKDIPDGADVHIHYSGTLNGKPGQVKQFTVVATFDGETHGWIGGARV
jgi:hypothetical protein